MLNDIKINFILLLIFTLNFYIPFNYAAETTQQSISCSVELSLVSHAAKHLNPLAQQKTCIITHL